MKIAQFLCFSPDLAEEHIAAVHVLPELPPCKRRPRWRRRLAGVIFQILIRPQGNSYTDASSTSHPKTPIFFPSQLQQRRGSHFCDPKSTFASDTSSVRRSDSDDDRGSDEAIFSSSSSSSPKSPSSSSSLSSPILAPKSKEEVEAAASKRCALCFLLVSLMVMVFCGRICAILWTASGLCCLPRRKPAPEAPEFSDMKTPAVAASTLPPTADHRPIVFCEYDKRRVVLEGFLGRSRRVYRTVDRNKSGRITGNELKT